MLKLILTSLLLLAPATVAAQCLAIEVRNPAGNYLVPGVRGDIVYRRVNGVELALDAYVQRRGARRPAVVVIHGGGWTSGSRVAFTGQWLEMLTRAGFNWFAVDYRQGGLARYQAALEDLRAALVFIRCHAAEFRIDPARIALLGEDSGAHLAALLAAEKADGVRNVVLIGGFYDLRAVPNLSNQHAADWLTQASPLTHLASKLPDTLLIHGDADNEVPLAQAKAYCTALVNRHHRCTLVTVAGGIHRAENWRPEQWEYKRALINWLRQALRLPAAHYQPYQTRLKKELPYARYVDATGKKQRLRLDLYTPPGTGPFPIAILVHGGGWEAGDKVTYITPLFAPLAQAGFAWVSIDYRLTPQSRHAAQLEDVRSAIEWVKANAAMHKLDAKRIALIGESASGQMVAQLATEGRRDLAAVVSFYGVYDFNALVTAITPRSIPARLFGLQQLNEEARTTLRRYSPLSQINTQMPPLLLLCGTQDRLFAQQQAFAEKLAAAGVPHETVALNGAPHGMENWEGHAEWQDYKPRLVAWLKQKLAR